MKKRPHPNPSPKERELEDKRVASDILRLDKRWELVYRTRVRRNDDAQSFVARYIKIKTSS